MSSGYASTSTGSGGRGPDRVGCSTCIIGRPSTGRMVVRSPATSISALAMIRSMSSRSSRQASRRRASPSSSGQDSTMTVSARASATARCTSSNVPYTGSPPTCPSWAGPSGGRQAPTTSSPWYRSRRSCRLMPTTASSCPTTMTRRRQYPRSRARCSRRRTRNRATTPASVASGSATTTYPRASGSSKPYAMTASVAVSVTPDRMTRWYSSVPTNRYRFSYARLAASAAMYASGSSADRIRYGRLYAVTSSPNRAPNAAAPAVSPTARSQPTRIRRYRRSQPRVGRWRGTAEARDAGRTGCGRGRGRVSTVRTCTGTSPLHRNAQVIHTVPGPVQRVAGGSGCVEGILGSLQALGDNRFDRVGGTVEEVLKLLAFGPREVGQHEVGRILPPRRSAYAEADPHVLPAAQRTRHRPQTVLAPFATVHLQTQPAVRDIEFVAQGNNTS